MGLGLGQLVTRDVSSLPGGDYLSFLGPGIMAATCMQSAVFESTFPIMGKIMWRRNYEAMLATPIEVRHILGGELLWIGFRMVLISSVFLVVLTLFRIPTSFLALLAVPACVLLGVAFCGGDHQLRRHPEERLRLRGAVPLRHQPALPVQRHLLPAEHAAGVAAWVEWIAAATPLYHGVALVRGAVLDDAGTLAGWPWHVAYLVDVRLGLRGRRPSAPEPQAGEVDGRTDGSHRSAPAWTDANRRRWSPSLLRARRLVQRNLLVYRHGWIIIVSGFFEPLFYLLGIGFGLGSLTDGVTLSDGRTIPYQAFVAPGLLAMSTLNGAIAESIFNVFFKLNFAHIYDGILATPLGSARSPSAS